MKILRKETSQSVISINSEQMSYKLTQNKSLNRLNQLQLYPNLIIELKDLNKDKNVIIKPETKTGNPKMQNEP